MLREFGEPPRYGAAFLWALVIVLATWLVVGEYYRVTTRQRPIVIVVHDAPADDTDGGPAGAAVPRAALRSGR